MDGSPGFSVVTSVLKQQCSGIIFGWYNSCWYPDPLLCQAISNHSIDHDRITGPCLLWGSIPTTRVSVERYETKYKYILNSFFTFCKNKFSTTWVNTSYLLCHLKNQIGHKIVSEFQNNESLKIHIKMIIRNLCCIILNFHIDMSRMKPMWAHDVTLIAVICSD